MKLLYVLALFLPSVCLAAPTALKSGMTMAEVIRLKGAPKDKDEHEVSRIIRWKYEDGIVVFKEGRLIVPQKRYVAVPLPETIEEPTTRANVPMALTQEVTDDIIRAIPNDTGPSAPVPGQPVGGGSSFVPSNPVILPDEP